ncbi:hypothetical protein B0T24DRAFT_165049 [Lasiosphaeria ovina]|uniref:Uncharacterized protein n=1 Tax=Lasiosphaeria ovina TaxID=92902 RepID=A0AAE0TT51_9PEZI|nr:hypothetical protein B0T24DRAFT_165049 [Lasiosphaeria ovina]
MAELPHWIDRERLEERTGSILKACEVPISSIRTAIKSANWNKYCGPPDAPWRDGPVAAFLEDWLRNYPKLWETKKYLGNWKGPLLLGTFHGHRLALDVGDELITSYDTTDEVFEQHDMTHYESTCFDCFKAGMRYDETPDKPGSQKTTIIQQFGRIVQKDMSTNGADKAEWEDTGFVLALDIGDKGRSGDFYILRNCTDLTGTEQWIQFMPRERGLCDKGEPFTVARVKTPPGADSPYDLLKDSGDDEHASTYEIQLERLSITTAFYVDVEILYADGEPVEGLLPMFAKPDWVPPERKSDDDDEVVFRRSRYL